MAMAMASEGSNEVGGSGGRSPSNGWLSKVVYPASKLSILFNYAFGKPFPKLALPPPWNNKYFSHDSNIKCVDLTIKYIEFESFYYAINC